MDNSLLITLSRQASLRRELEIVANNVANINTTAFKADGAVFSEYLMPGAQAGQFGGADRRLSFVQDRMTWADMGQGSIQRTGNPLDVAIDGDGFLVVQTPRGERYTRNGALQLNAQGELVTSAGHQVLGEGGPIAFNPNDRDISINPDGTIRVREGNNPTSDALRGRLRLVSFVDAQQLTKDGANTYATGADMPPQPAAAARVVQGAIEKSNVRAVVEMSRMIELTRAYTEIANIMQKHTEQRRDTIQRLAEVPA